MDIARDVASEKRQLRRSMRQLRATISADLADRNARSARLWHSVVDEVAIRLQTAAPAVMLFESLPTEPDTSTWLDDARRRGWTLFVPLVDGPDLRVMPGSADPHILDVVVVPGLAFTPDGWRLGQGGGHYDRFIARLRPRCLTVGACYSEQLLDQLPIEAHDRAVDVVVTDAQASSDVPPSEPVA